MRTLIGALALLAVNPAAGGEPPRCVLHELSRGGYLGSANGPAERRSNGGACAPDRAEPLWSRDSMLLGYACFPASANGG